MHCFDRYHRCTDGDVPPNPDSLADLGYAADTVENELGLLFRDYGRVVYGSRHKAPCGAWRAEQNLLQDSEASRFTNRVHVYQRTGMSDRQFGDYVGYVSLRPPPAQPPPRKVPMVSDDKYRYTIVANITPPFHMQRPRYHIITCLAGPADGVLPFPASPFCVPRHDTRNRASCLHMALHQGLLLKMDQFGFSPITSQDLLNLVWEVERTTQSPLPKIDSITEDGCNLEQAQRVLPKAQAGCVLETFLDGETAAYEALRCMTDYLANDLPVVAELEETDSAGQKHYHAVLVLGMHLLQDAEDAAVLDGTRGIATGVGWHELPGRLVVHDMLAGPFCEMQTAKFLEQAWFDGYPSMSFLALAPKGTTVGIAKIRSHAKRFVFANRRRLYDYCAYYGLPREQPGGMRYVTRLLKRWQVEQWHIRRPLGDTLTLPGNRNDYCWCVEVRLPAGSTATESPGPDLTQPAFVLVWHIDAGQRESPDLALVCQGEKVVEL